MHRMTPGEARRTVHRESRAAEPTIGATALGDLERLSSNDLKVAEYSLLVKPVTEGLENYLSNYGDRTPWFDMSYNTMVKTTGSKVGRQVLEIAKQDRHWDLMYTLAAVRSARLQVQAFAPLERDIVEAAEFSVMSMGEIATANALTLKRDGIHQDSEQAFYETVRRSSKLAILRTMTSFAWQKPISLGLGRYNQEIGEQTRERKWYHRPNPKPAPVFNDGILIYNPEIDEVVPTKGFAEWDDPIRKTLDERRHYKIGDRRHRDVKVGCPVSFKPSLVPTYYGHVVDLMWGHRAWPKELQPEKTFLQALNALQ